MSKRANYYQRRDCKRIGLIELKAPKACAICDTSGVDGWFVGIKRVCAHCWGLIVYVESKREEAS